MKKLITSIAILVLPLFVGAQSIGITLPITPSFKEGGFGYNPGAFVELYGFAANVYLDGNWTAGYIFSSRNGNICSEDLYENRFGVFAGPNQAELSFGRTFEVVTVDAVGAFRWPIEQGGLIISLRVGVILWD